MTMGNYCMHKHKIPHFEILDDIHKGIQELARQKQTHDSYMQARASVLADFGWDSSYDYDQWRKKLKRSFHKVQNSSSRLQCIVSENPQCTDGVYIFELPVEIVTNLSCISDYVNGEVVKDLMSSKYISELPDLIDEFVEEYGEFSNEVSLDIAPSRLGLRSICNIWVKNIEYLNREQRRPSRNCRAEWAFNYANHSSQDLYLITNKEDFKSWATSWGGLAIIPKGVRGELDESDTVVNSIFSDYTIRKCSR